MLIWHILHSSIMYGSDNLFIKQVYVTKLYIFFYVDLMIHEVAFNCLELFQVILIDKMLTLMSINVDLIQQFDTNITNRRIIRK